MAIKVCVSSWRRANPDKEWENCLRDIIIETDDKKVPPQIRKAVQNVIKRLHLISSGHAECPVPQNEQSR